MKTDDMVHAMRVRRLGGLPTCIPMQHCDIGEAIDDFGDRYYITWGRDLESDDVAWYAARTCFRPIWVNRKELVLCRTDSPMGEWIRHGLEINVSDGPQWEEVKDG